MSPLFLTEDQRWISKTDLLDTATLVTASVIKPVRAMTGTQRNPKSRVLQAVGRTEVIHICRDLHPNSSHALLLLRYWDKFWRRRKRYKLSMELAVTVVNSTRNDHVWSVSSLCPCSSCEWQCRTNVSIKVAHGSITDYRGQWINQVIIPSIF